MIVVISQIVGSLISFENPFPEPWEVIFLSKNRFPDRGRSFFFRKFVSRIVGDHFSFENSFPEPWERAKKEGGAIRRGGSAALPLSVFVGSGNRPLICPKICPLYVANQIIGSYFSIV